MGSSKPDFVLHCSPEVRLKFMTIESMMLSKLSHLCESYYIVCLKGYIDKRFIAVYKQVIMSLRDKCLRIFVQFHNSDFRIYLDQ